MTADPISKPTTTPVLPRYTVLPVEHLAIGPRAVPALLVRPDGNGRHPGALLQHGYGASKADLLPMATALAAYGFVVLLPDAWGHGDRFPTSGPNWMTELHAEYALNVVRETTGDLSEALSVLADRSEVRDDALLIGGFSMGAVVALIAGSEDARVGGIVSIAGSPLSDLLGIRLFGSVSPSEQSRAWAEQHDVVRHVDRLAPRPLLLSHGGKDDMVPVGGTLRLYEAAKPFYADHPERLTLRLYDHTHVVSEPQLRDAVNWIVPFFASCANG